MVDEEIKQKGNLENEKASGQSEESSQSSVDLSDTKTEGGEEKEEHKDSRSKDKLYEEISIPSEITTSVEDDVLIMKKGDKEVKRKLTALIEVKVEGDKVIIRADRVRKIERRLFGTYKAHVRNMIKGLTEGFVFKLQIANVHFPMNVSFDKANNSIVVKNFLGEKTDRVIKMPEGVDIKVDKENIEVSAHDIELAGDAATKIEKGTKVRNKDRRIFQDGCFLVQKPGRSYV